MVFRLSGKKLLSQLKITLKNTIPIYFVVSFVTFIFLLLGDFFKPIFPFKDTLFFNFIFALTYTLLYLIPQTLSVFFALFMMKLKGVKWLLRISPSASILITFIFVIIFKSLGFFPHDANGNILYVNLMMIIILNIFFTTMISVKILMKLKNVVKKPHSKSDKSFLNKNN